MASNNIAENSTGKKKVPGKPFIKGDPRCYRKGRPRTFDQLRAAALKIASEMVPDDADKSKKVMRVNRILRRMAESTKHVQSFLEIAYGKVPQDLNMNINNLAELFASVQDKKT